MTEPNSNTGAASLPALPGVPRSESLDLSQNSSGQSNCVIPANFKQQRRTSSLLDRRLSMLPAVFEQAQRNLQQNLLLITRVENTRNQSNVFKMKSIEKPVKISAKVGSKQRRSKSKTKVVIETTSTIQSTEQKTLAGLVESKSEDEDVKSLRGSVTSISTFRDERGISSLDSSLTSKMCGNLLSDQHLFSQLPQKLAIAAHLDVINESSIALEPAPSTPEAHRKKKKRSYPTVSRILPFLIQPLCLPTVPIPFKVAFNKSKLRTQDIYQKFLNGKISINQRESGDLTVGPGGSAFLVTKVWKKMNARELASFRASNPKAYRVHVKQHQDRILNSEKRMRMEEIRIGIVLRLEMLKDTRTKVEDIQLENLNYKIQYEQTSQRVNGRISYLLRALESLDMEVLNTHELRKQELKTLGKKFMKLEKEFSKEHNGFERKRAAKELRLEDIGLELEALKEFRITMNVNPEFFAATNEFLQEQKQKKANFYEQQIKEKYKRWDTDKLESEGEMMSQLIGTIESENVKLSLQFTGSLRPAHSENVRLKKDIEMQRSHQGLISKEIKELERQRKILSVVLEKTRDKRRDVLDRKPKICSPDDEVVLNFDHREGE